MRSVALALLLVAATAPAAAQAPAEPPAEAPAAAPRNEPSDTAMTFAGEFAGDHLSGMLSRIGAQSEALRALARFDGPTVATVFDAQIDAAVRRHRDTWARNLALAWSPLLSEGEMRSLAEQGAESPHAATYVENREAAAAAMARLSGELFAGILQEVVAATVETLVPEAPPD